MHGLRRALAHWGISGRREAGGGREGTKTTAGIGEGRNEENGGDAGEKERRDRTAGMREGRNEENGGETGGKEQRERRGGGKDRRKRRNDTDCSPK